jgi:hypothetical protein
MSTTDTSGFGAFVPGFDFLQNLAKGASGGAPTTGLPNLSQWLVPSLNVEDLEKRIEELKHVQFWLEQNSRALSATIQALEVQKMTMATLKGMNFTMGMPGAGGAPSTAPPAPAAAASTSSWPLPASSSKPESAPAPASAPAPESVAKPTAPAAGVVDPLQLWGSLTQQFQTIAAQAFKEVSAKVAAAPVKTNAAAHKATKAAKPTPAKAAARKTARPKAPAKKAPATKTPARKSTATTRQPRA